MHALRLQAVLKQAPSHGFFLATEQAADFYSEHVLAHAPALATTVSKGAQSLLAFPDSAWVA